MKLDVVRAVVTGAAGGLGRVFCRFFLFIYDFRVAYSPILLLAVNHIDIEIYLGLTSRQLLAAGAKVMATDFDSKQLAEMQGDSGAMRCEYSM